MTLAPQRSCDPAVEGGRIKGGRRTWENTALRTAQRSPPPRRTQIALPRERHERARLASHPRTCFSFQQGQMGDTGRTEHPSYRWRPAGVGRGPLPNQYAPRRRRCLIPFMFFFSLRNGSHSAGLSCLQLLFFYTPALPSYTLWKAEELRRPPSSCQRQEGLGDITINLTSAGLMGGCICLPRGQSRQSIEKP